MKYLVTHRPHDVAAALSVVDVVEACDVDGAEAIIKEIHPGTTLLMVTTSEPATPSVRTARYTDGLPRPPYPYTAEELERDNPYNAWMFEDGSGFTD